MTATQDDVIAELQCANAELRRERHMREVERDTALARQAALAEELAARDATLAQRNTEYGERIEQQAATIDVLKVMSSSPGNAQPIFELIVERARAFCGADQCTVALLDGDMLHLKAKAGMSEASARNYAAQFPRPVNTASMFGRAILAQEAVQTPDVLADPEHFSQTRVGGPDPEFRAIVAVPMLRAGTPIGAIALVRKMPGVYPAIQMELLQTFAEQAVIAITSAETYRALQTRTGDLQQSLEYQTATSDVLKVISRSAFDLQPVLDTVVETAARLCDADMAGIGRREGELIRGVAFHGYPPEYRAWIKSLGAMPLDKHIVGHRAAVEGRVVHVHDVAAEPNYPTGSIALGKMRTSLGVPLLREGETVGAIVLARQRVEPFTDRQIELVSTFADQAVIAIENTRLITEQREALEQQTATAEVLQVINASPGNLAPVFDAMLEKAMRLCGAAFGSLYTYDGERFLSAAQRGVPPAFAAFRARHPPTPEKGGGPATLLETRKPHHVLDIKETETYRVGQPGVRAMVELGGVRTVLIVPLLKDDALLGYISVYRQEVRAFSDKQIALLQNFAAQAVIAMENARLITEQREALEQQTATADVLQIINASPGNLEPVFDALLEKSLRLCEAEIGLLHTYDGDLLRLVATHGVPPTLVDYLMEPHRPPPRGYMHRIVQGENVVHLNDVKDSDAYRSGDEARRAFVDLGGARTAVYVALRKDNTLLGVMVIFRQEVRAFSDKSIALLRNFAAQAVIAMENARLLTEQREALEQQTATAEVLQVINASPGDLAPVFNTMLDNALRLCDANFGQLITFDGVGFRAAAWQGFPPEPNRPGATTPPARGMALHRLIHGEEIIHVPDITADEVYRSGNPTRRRLADEFGGRTAIWVALKKDTLLLGSFVIYRTEVRPFSHKQISLLQSFAAQAVIAIENARLITEQREALEQQTATAEVLQVINRSRGDLVPVFDAILESAHSLCDIARGSLELYDGVSFHAVAIRGLSADLADTLRRGYPASDNPATRPLIEGGRLSHIRDLRETNYSITRSAVETDAARTLLCVPLRRDETLLGMIASARSEVRPFSEKEIALLENFAAQAVIAIENARLLNEQREALEQQTATAEVLQVINTSPGDLGPVFNTMLEKALTLCGAEHGSLGTYDGDYFRAVASRGYPAAVLETLQGGFHGMENPVTRPLFDGARFVQIADLGEIDHPIPKAIAALGGFRTVLFVPLRKDGKLLGHISASRQEVRSFAAKEIALLENFAAQAVIAMENARLLDEIRQRQAELRVTFENMGDGVAMFDETSSLVAWNQKFQDILDLPDGVLAERLAFPNYIRYLTERGEYGEGANPEEQIRRLTGQVGEVRAYERTRPDGRVIEIRRNPVPSGGFVLIFSDITERKRNEAEIHAARDAAEEASRTIEAAYRDLKAAQANLIQAEKMASLGQLTAGIAHEIKNPLNFVNNFSALSTELIDELRDVLAPEPLGETARTEVNDLTALLKGNLEKVVQHGQRADGIVRSMLDHSRGSSGERRMVDLNALIDEALNLAYHGARAQDQSFNITLERDFAEGVTPIEVNPQDITRVFLNIFSNGFYATTRRARDGGDAGFEPTLKITTRDAGEAVEIRVRDNGIGIPADIRDKLFQPFFTTKPTGEGTGLGLSITYDIVTQQHGGSIAVDSNVGEYSEFTILLPRNP